MFSLIVWREDEVCAALNDAVDDYLPPGLSAEYSKANIVWLHFFNLALIPFEKLQAFLLHGLKKANHGIVSDVFVAQPVFVSQSSK